LHFIIVYDATGVILNAEANPSVFAEDDGISRTAPIGAASKVFAHVGQIAKRHNHASHDHAALGVLDLFRKKNASGGFLLDSKVSDQNSVSRWRRRRLNLL
tara:strand:+ start:714 stop:1016 length:303 start_codon:yes stop_codon:yes gene_type:complete